MIGRAPSSCSFLSISQTSRRRFSRSAIVDQDALLAALHEGRIAGAGLDVFDIEPLPADHPMRTAPRLLATPHLGYVSLANYRTYYGQAVEDIHAFLDGSPVRRLG